MRLLDLFCGAGGAGMGYHRAGFEVVGVDLRPQPNYPFEFHQVDAMTYPLDGFDAIHASPPCQAYADAGASRKRTDHPDLLDPVRQLLKAAGKPYVIENVPLAPMPTGVLLCGSTFGLPIIRHRRFEIEPDLLLVPSLCHQERHGHAVDHGPVIQGQTAGRTCLRQAASQARLHRVHRRASAGALGGVGMTRRDRAEGGLVQPVRHKSLQREGICPFVSPSSNDGYCKCVLPASHKGSHKCMHGWLR